MFQNIFKILFCLVAIPYKFPLAFQFCFLNNSYKWHCSRKINYNFKCFDNKQFIDIKCTECKQYLIKIVILLGCVTNIILCTIIFMHSRFQLHTNRRKDNVYKLDFLFFSIVRTATIPALGAIIENVSLVDVSTL